MELYAWCFWFKYREYDVIMSGHDTLSIEAAKGMECLFLCISKTRAGVGDDAGGSCPTAGGRNGLMPERKRGTRGRDWESGRAWTYEVETHKQVQFTRQQSSPTFTVMGISSVSPIFFSAAQLRH
jgi:hypothetical protein